MPQTEYQKQWYLDNRERELAKHRVRYENNKPHRLAKQKAYYDENKNDPIFRAKRIERQRNRRKERSLWWRELKSTMQCSKCEESRPPCLDFHHIDPREKDFNPSKAILEFVPMKRILEELKKCIVLCSNCHRMHHYNEHT